MSHDSKSRWGSTGGDESGAFAATSASSASPLRFVHNDRYRDLDLVGLGGMGVVHRAFDTRLEREVALKVVRVKGEEAEARLAREAMVTARLDHPGVVPVHDVGRTESGEAFFVMRLIRGRTLAQVLADTGTSDGRADLQRLRAQPLRHFLDACETIAFAHARGIGHLDLKPSNIMVGPFGETQVTDWGLARELPLPARTAPHPGTRAYMSPEQAAGEAVDTRADVWSLGVILLELLTGRRQRDPHASAADRASFLPGTPVELVAIARRALALRPDDRYADASELAADIVRWFDGQLVSAHDYGPLDLLKRFARVWRVPIALTLVAIAVVAAVSAEAYRRTVRERDLARRAEAVAVEAKDAESRALGSAQASLGLALLSRAHDALKLADRATAEVLAASARELTDTPLADGILAAFAASPRPQLRSRVELPDCDQISLSSDEHRLACVAESEVRGLDKHGRVELRARADAEFAARLADETLVWLDPEDRLWVQARDTPPRLAAEKFAGVGPMLAAGPHLVARVSPRQIISYDTASGEVHETFPCPKDALVSRWATDHDGHALILCLDGSIRDVDLISGADSKPLTHLPPSFGPPFAMAWDANRRQLAVGSTDGQLFVWRGRDAAPTHARLTSRAAVDSLSFDAGGTRLLAVNSLGRVGLFDLEARAWLAHFPARGYRVARWLSADEVQLAGSSVDIWRLDPSTRPTRLPGSSGVADVHAGRTGTRFVQTLGDGQVLLRDAASGVTLAQRRWQSLVAKAVAVSPDGTRAAVANIGAPKLVVFDFDGDAELQVESSALRRILWLHDGLLTFPYSGDAHWYSQVGRDFAAPQSIVSGRTVDAELLPNHRAAVFVDKQGTVRRSYPPAESEIVFSLPQANAVLALDDEQILVAQGRTLAHWNGAKLERDLVAPMDAEIYDMALSPDGAHIALGTLDGELVILDGASLEVRARIAAHENRVSSLAFTADGTLLSGSWDGSVRVWSLDPIVEPARYAPDAVEADWGLTRDEAMAGRTR